MQNYSAVSRVSFLFNKGLMQNSIYLFDLIKITPRKLIASAIQKLFHNLI